jgi:hypothetical protein
MKTVNDGNVKVEVNPDTPNAKAEANEKRGFDLPLFAMPGIFRGIAEQGAVRARDNCEKIKAASGEIADILRETYSTNARGAADYGVKVRDPGRQRQLRLRFSRQSRGHEVAIGSHTAVSRTEPQEL